MKKVLLVIIDSATGWVFEQALAEDRLPHLAQLVGAGEIRYDSVAVFPSITPAATSSIATGRYPVEHHIAGNYWFDKSDNSLAYYGPDVLAILHRGVAGYFEDFLVKFNHNRLKAPTIFHTVEAADLVSASLNFLIFHGPHAHDVTIPPLVDLLPGAEISKTVCGPTILSLGDLVRPQLPGAAEPLDTTGGPLHKFGFDDDNTAALLHQMAEQRAFPDFTLAYFPDYDGACHDSGPLAALPTIEKIDGFLGELIAIYGGVESLLADVCIVLSGDHAQTDIVDGKEAGILLNDLLQGFDVAEAGVPVEKLDKADSLIVCPNLRMAQIYVRSAKDERMEQIEQIAGQLVADQRVDQAMWVDTAGDSEGPRYHIHTRDRGHLSFWRGKDGAESAVDVYGCHWSWSGDLRAVDGSVDGGTIGFGDYPNAFERVVCFLDLDSSGDVVVTAHPGYEFRLLETSVHTGGGSHAALHRADSLSPLLLAGAPPGVHLPDHPRTVDLAPLCLSILGVDAQRRVGESHVSPVQASAR